jgi:hypothetical protein
MFKAFFPISEMGRLIWFVDVRFRILPVITDGPFGILYSHLPMMRINKPPPHHLQIDRVTVRYPLKLLFNADILKEIHFSKRCTEKQKTRKYQKEKLISDQFQNRNTTPSVKLVFIVKTKANG